MSRKNIAMIICLAASLSLVLMAGCKKKTADGGSKSGMTASDTGMKAPPTADMDPMDPDGMQPGMSAARPVAKPGKGRVGAMPIPYDFMIITAHLKAARKTALYKKYEPKIKAMFAGAMAKRKALADMLKTCKVDVLNGVDGVTVGHSTDNQDPEATVILAWGGFDTGKLMACMKPELKKAKIEFKDATIGGKEGVEVTMKGKSATVLALSPSSLVMLGKPVVALATAVLEGKLQSIEDTANYKEGAKMLAAKPATILSVLVPKIPASLMAKVQFPIAKKVRTVAAMIGVPDDGLEVHVGADFGDDKTATSLARTLPALLGFAKAKLGAIGAKLLENLKIKAEGTWVRLALTTDKATFEKLQGMVMGLLLKAMPGGDSDPKPTPPTKPVPAPKKGKKAKKGKK